MNPSIHASIYVKDLPEIDGYGVFAKEDIPRNTIIEVSPVFTFPKKILDMSIYLSMSEGIPPNELGIDQYAIYWNPMDKESLSAIMLGYLSIYNHSNKNNSSFFIFDFSKRLVGVKTARDISKDEQLTVNYGSDWFNKKDYVNMIDF
jgi:SET domain-containing protein